MNINNQKAYNLFSIFFVLMLLIIVFLGVISGMLNAKENHVKPLNQQQQQAIVSQIGIDGYKQLIKVRCYDSVTIRTHAERWSDKFCADSYNHLDFEKILHGEL